jgi:hypothetical protein
MALYCHVNYQVQHGVGDFNFGWDAITHQSSVVITAAEGKEPVENGTVLLTNESPERFIGAAQFTVHNVAPYDGGVTFRLEINDGNPLVTWVCITVFDNADYFQTDQS